MPFGMRLVMRFQTACLFTADERANKKTTVKVVVFVGCASWTVMKLLQQHRKEVISIKDQLRYVMERLAA